MFVLGNKRRNNHRLAPQLLNILGIFLYLSSYLFSYLIESKSPEKTISWYVFFKIIFQLRYNFFFIIDYLCRCGSPGQ